MTIDKLKKYIDERIKLHLHHKLIAREHNFKEMFHEQGIIVSQLRMIRNVLDMDNIDEVIERLEAENNAF